MKLQIVKIGGNLARNARFDAPTCLVSSLWLSCGLAVSMGGPAKPLLFEVSKQVVMSFCVSGVALCDIPTCWMTCRESCCGLRRFHRMNCSFRGRRSILEISVVILCGRLHNLHFTLHTLHSTLYALHSTLYTPHSKLYTPHSTPYTLHFTLYTLHSTLHTLHFTLHTLHSTLYTPPSALYTLHSTL